MARRHQKRMSFSWRLKNSIDLFIRRLFTAMYTCTLLPAGLFWLAWCASHLFTVASYQRCFRSSQPSVHYMVPILSGIPFGCGMSQIIQGLQQYLMDAYGVYCASALAATVVLRSLCGAIFPLFIPAMFKALGDQWAVSVFAFIALACTPLPLLFVVRSPIPLV